MCTHNRFSWRNLKNVYLKTAFSSAKSSFVNKTAGFHCAVGSVFDCRYKSRKFESALHEFSWRLIHYLIMI